MGPILLRAGSPAPCRLVRPRLRRGGDARTLRRALARPARGRAGPSRAWSGWSVPRVVGLVRPARGRAGPSLAKVGLVRPSQKSGLPVLREGRAGPSHARVGLAAAAPLPPRVARRMQSRPREWSYAVRIWTAAVPAAAVGAVRTPCLPRPLQCRIPRGRGWQHTVPL
eukprot:gene15014-biopygen8341